MDEITRITLECNFCNSLANIEYDLDPDRFQVIICPFCGEDSIETEEIEDDE